MMDLSTPTGTSAPLVITLQALGRKDLLREFAARGYTKGAEIGVWQGRFAEQLCRAIPDLQLIGVDAWHAYDEYRDGKNNQRRLEGAYAEAQRRVAPYTCRLVRMLSIIAAQQIPDRSLDFVYIDANHAKRFVYDDLAAWTPKVRSGGIVAGHDYTENPPKPYIQVKAAVEVFTRERAIRPLYVLAADTSPSFFWVVQE